MDYPGIPAPPPYQGEAKAQIINDQSPLYKEVMELQYWTEQVRDRLNLLNGTLTPVLAPATPRPESVAPDLDSPPSPLRSQLYGVRVELQAIVAEMDNITNRVES